MCISNIKDFVKCQLRGILHGRNCHTGLDIKYVTFQSISETCSVPGVVTNYMHHRPLTTAMARVRSQFRSSGTCGGQSCTKVEFLLVLRVPLPIFIPPPVPVVIIICTNCFNKLEPCTLPTAYAVFCMGLTIYGDCFPK
jgi:hypothetical protein